MIDSILRSNKDFEEVLAKIGKLTLKDETREYLKLNLATCYENRKNSEHDVIKYSIKILLSLLVYLILVNTTIESATVGFVSIKDLSLITIFFPIVILYYALVMSATDLFRVQNTVSFPIFRSNQKYKIA